MHIENNRVIFENNEKEIWENLLERSLSSAITSNVLRELGEARVREFREEGNLIWARMAANIVDDIPKVMH